MVEKLLLKVYLGLIGPRGAVCVPGGVKHSQNSSILPAPVGAGAAAAAAQVRGNTAP